MISAVQMGNTKRDNLLSSWKEIAAYLDCDVRTCYRWENKYGLPVYRVDEKSKSRVYAYKDELDEWLKSRNTRNSSQSDIKSQKRGHLIRPSVLLATLILGVAIIYFLFLRNATSPVPADFRIQNSNLIIVNEEGKELWRYDTGIENLRSEDHYRLHFQRKKNSEDGLVRDLPQIMIKDINDDNLLEVLFSPKTTTELGEGKLLCFNPRGEFIWNFETGRELIFGQKVYSKDYRIRGFEVVDLNHDGTLEIVVISDQFPDFPTQLVILDSEGKRIGEYWNSGRMQDFVCIDIDEDGREELIVGSMNNEHAKASLIVFDASNIHGCSPQEKDYYKFDDFEPGTEKYYVLFPRIDFLRLEMMMEPIAKINILKNGLLSATTGYSGLFYEFDRKFELQNIGLSHRFQMMHKNAFADGRATSELNDDYIKNLEQGLLYWNGEKWVSEPAINKKWERSRD
jgi:hypothetical protein